MRSVKPTNASVPKGPNRIFFFSGPASFVLLIATLFFSSCNSDSIAEKQLKSLDSISGALNLKLKELQQVDTVILQKAIARYDQYRQFIRQNVNDTVTKNEADHLGHFYLCGKKLSDFSENRSAILARGGLINSQLAKLIADIRENTVDDEKLEQFAQQEKSEAEQLIKSSFEQQQLFLTRLEEFKMSITAVEALIRSRNNGQMPTVIKDSIPL